MKLKSMLLTSLLAAMVALSAGAHAAADMDPAAMTETTSGQPAGQAATTKMHSHVQEKTGMPQKMPAAKAENPKAKSTPATDKHFHPRDGK
jgi:hypothetical protein